MHLFRSWPFAVLCLAAVSAARLQAQPSATPVDRIRLLDGFQVELLYSVPADQGSWVSMTHDPKGRLIVSDQYGTLYRVTVSGDAKSTHVERLKVPIGQAHGLLYAFDSLYVMVGEAGRGSGLYRARDTNGDDQFDQVELLRKIQGAGEHGPHAVLLSPDGESLYIAAGNHTDLPDVQSSRVPRNWQEDQLLPRMWDAGGHAVGRLAPGGWICRTDPEGKTLELISSGYRNEFDIAFNRQGELFTYDADMEWDIGSPWYRPTRICHVTSGSEFGWRSGTGKWPAYYPDSLPAAVDIGPGSPTGIAFGTGAKFPAKYQRALFVSDWSFGLIYAVHLRPDGASYSGEFERFAFASPLPVTDLLVHPKDGALYFTIGGRRTQSGLYRVSYQGDESTTAAEQRVDPYERDRALRSKLEAFHAVQDPQTVEIAWPYLSHRDRFIRYAARIAVEHQPVASWQDRVFAEEHPQASITALIALARCGDASLQPQLLEALGRIPGSELTASQQLELIRAYALTFIRMGPASGAQRQNVVARFDSQYPSENRSLNRELSQLLVYLEAPGVVERTLQLLRSARTQQEQIQNALVLRTLKSGWTLDQRREYFEWFNDTGSFRGGHSFSGFLRNIRNEAIELLDEQTKESLASLLSAERQNTQPDVALKARPFVKKWAVADLLDDVSDGLRRRNFDRGREAFSATGCFKCHRFQQEGGIIGPDLTGVGGRFTPQYVLESLIEPSKAVSDQYQATVFLTDSGKTVVGKIANLNGERLMIITNMLEPGSFTVLQRSEIEEQHPSPVSMMPTGSLDTLNRDEILDLIAYLRSGGNPSHEMFSEQTR